MFVFYLRSILIQCLCLCLKAVCFYLQYIWFYRPTIRPLRATCSGCLIRWRMKNTKSYFIWMKGIKCVCANAYIGTINWSSYSDFLFVLMRVSWNAWLWLHSIVFFRFAPLIEISSKMICESVCYRTWPHREQFHRLLVGKLEIFGFWSVFMAVCANSHSHPHNKSIEFQQQLHPTRQ